MPAVAHACPSPEPYHLRTPGPARFGSRAAEVATTFSTRLGPVLARQARNRSVSARDVARPIRRSCEDLGATFLKYAQIVASSESLFGAEVSAEFRDCLDTGPIVPFPRVARELERAAGRPLDQIFADIEPHPIGRASLAVVHRATLRDGRVVAVKVLRPGVEARIAADLALMRQVLAPLATAVAGGAGAVFVAMIEQLKEQLEQELDLRNEARTMAYFRALPERAQLPLVVVPETYDALSSRRVLVMEYLDGVPIDDFETAQLAGIDPRPLVEQAVQAWFMTALRGGIFHGDVHAGNLLILRDGRVGLLDWGIVGRLSPEGHTMLRSMVAGALGDQKAWVVVAEALFSQMGDVRERLGLDAEAIAPILESVLGGLLTRPFGEVSLSEMIMAPRRQLEELRKQASPEMRRRIPRTPFGQLAALRRVDANAPEMDRGLILLAKQLAYFERYGRLYLPDRPLLGDEDFFRSVLAAGPLTAD